MPLVLRNIPLELDDKVRQQIERVCVDFDVIGNLVQHGLVPLKELLEGHYDVIIKVWDAAESFVTKRRNRKDYGQYVPMFEKLKIKAEKYRSARGRKKPKL